MGTSSSSCTETPVKVVYNRHLGDVLDPRSPTAGILRTPIEVLGSPSTPESRLEPCVQEEEQTGEPSGSPDPRSPTPGVSRTPLKTSVAEGLGSLAKQLTDMFISPERGTQGDDGSPVGVEATDQLLDCEGEEEGTGAGDADPPAQPDQGDPIDTGEQRPTKKAVHREAQRPSSRARKSQPGRPQLVSVKGRCPLQLLKDDNSPTCSLARRQVKATLRPSGSPGELMPWSPLKLGHSPADKENHSSPWVSGERRPCPP
ncbi:cell division cycle-associated protein 3 [Hypanus sabinus]|uniref:cell division cycle-associated protein 3 n=1 Tax=Hypanus sabinus TaxID=79690 RepID=UPI0028C4821F|nr:cell division cycle-associated protein 3 [Hypanus sabinus]